MYGVNYTDKNTAAGTLQNEGNQVDNVCYTYDEKDLEFAKWHFMTAFLFGPFSYLFAI